MGVVGGLLGVSAAFICFVLLLVVLVVALVVWFWKRQKDQKVMDTAPEPPIQATIEHPTAASGAPTQDEDSGASGAEPPAQTPSGDDV